jgi:hypothetical protein
MLTALLVAVNPFFHDFAYHLGTDMLGVLLCLASAFFLSKQCRGCYVTSGILFGLAVCTRYEFAILLIIAVIYLGWRKRLVSFIVPLAVILIFNFIIVDLPGGFDVLPYKYFGRGVVDQDHFSRQEYDGLLKVLTASPLKVIQVYIRDLAQVVAEVSEGLILAPCIVGFLLAVWKNRQYAFIGFAFLLHLLYVNALLPPSPRFLFLEVTGITAIGTVFIWKYLLEAYYTKRWIVLLCLFIPFLAGQSKQSFTTLMQNKSDPGAHFLKWREFIQPGSRILSTHGQTAVITGGEWILWQVDIEDINKYCIENKIDFVVWSAHEATARSEWREKFDDPERAYPEFIGLDVDSRIGSLYQVSLKGDTKVSQDSAASIE